MYQSIPPVNPLSVYSPWLLCSSLLPFWLWLLLLFNALSPHNYFPTEKQWQGDHGDLSHSFDCLRILPPSSVTSSSLGGPCFLSFWNKTLRLLIIIICKRGRWGKMQLSKMPTVMHIKGERREHKHQLPHTIGPCLHPFQTLFPPFYSDTRTPSVPPSISTSKHQASSRSSDFVIVILV